jgi:uncharacterized coiled-coil protein SlyX
VTTMDRTNTFVSVIPATALAESNVWRVTIQWHEHSYWQRFDVTDIKERGKFIREWCDKIGVPWEHVLWIDGAIDEELNVWRKENEAYETIERRLTLLLSRVNDQEKTIDNLVAALEKAEQRIDRLAGFCEMLRQERRAAELERKASK